VPLPSVAAPASIARSALATIPVDVMVAQMQSAAKAGKKVSIVETFKEQGGLGAVVAFSTRGLMARVAHVALTTMAMRFITSKVYGERQRRRPVGAGGAPGNSSCQLSAAAALPHVCHE
jgi:hypothetical protein